MFYRVTADMLFLVEDEANDFRHDCEMALPKAIVINPGQENQECSWFLQQKCYHDETPPQECVKTHSTNNCP